METDPVKNESLNDTPEEPKEEESSNFFGRFFSSVTKALDQNDDGAFDFKDIASMAEAVGNTVKDAAVAVADTVTEGGAAIGNKIEQARREAELKELQPVFARDLKRKDFQISKLIRLTEIDKKHAESDLCKGSVGFKTDQKEMSVVNIYRANLDSFGLSFYPDASGEIYYEDPCNPSLFIHLDDYFNYLRIARISELQKIAQDLGAKHFRVSFKDQQTSFLSQKITEKTNLKTKKLIEKLPDAGIEESYSHQDDSESFSLAEIAAELYFEGHEPVMPKLVYFRHDPSIRNLIEMRMSGNTFNHQKLSLNLIQTSGIKSSDAAKIEAALKAMKCSGNLNISKEVKNESKRLLEYEIDF